MSARGGGDLRHGAPGRTRGIAPTPGCHGSTIPDTDYGGSLLSHIHVHGGLLRFHLKVSQDVVLRQRAPVSRLDRKDPQGAYIVDRDFKAIVAKRRGKVERGVVYVVYHSPGCHLSVGVAAAGAESVWAHVLPRHERLQ